MKKLRRIITLILALLVVFSCVACNKEEEVKKPTVKKLEYTGVHEFKATDIEGKYLVKNGQTEYTLVYPEETDYLKLRNVARREFLYFFNMATGISMPSITDAGLEHSPTNKYISLGDTTLLRQAVIEDPSLLNAELNSQGVKIVTKDDTIFIFGSSDYGAVYGVYTFMEMEFNFDFYYTTCYEIDTDVNEIPLRQYEVTDVPDIRLRCPTFGYQTVGSGKTDDELYDSWRGRKNYNWNRWILQIHKEFDDINSPRENCHGVFTFTPPDVYSAEHGAWFSSQQPCFTAHGDAEEYELMVQEYVKKIQNALKLYPVKENPWVANVHVGIMDGGGHCGCTTCSQVAQLFKTTENGGAPNGSQSAAVILFMNQVAKEIKNWMNTPVGGEAQPWWDDYISVYCEDEWKRPDLEFTFFAYGDYNDCPADLNKETGKYEALSATATENLYYLTQDMYTEEMTGTLSANMRHDVGTWYCNPANGTSSFYAEDEDPTAVNTARARLQMWGDLTDVIWIWGYSTNFSNYTVMSNYYAAYGDELYQAMQAAGVVGVFNQCVNLDDAATAFQLLKAYLDNKLSWNATYNQQELTMKFFKAMYRDGWQEMYEFFEDYRTFVIEGPTLDLNFSEMKKQSYPQVLIDKWIGLLDKAIEKNARLKETDKILYENTVNHINIEFVSPAWMAINWYEENYPADVMMAMKTRMKESVISNGISCLRENDGGALYQFVENF